MEQIKQLNEYGNFVGNVFLGRLYTYKYRALPDRSKENPYFDRYPTTIIIKRHDSLTFDGINFNHIDIERRLELMDNLKPFFMERDGQKFFEYKEYREVAHLRKFRLAYVCLRRYRLKNCYAGIVRVRDDIWNETIMEANERFFSTSTLKQLKSETIWLDSLRRSRMFK